MYLFVVWFEIVFWNEFLINLNHVFSLVLFFFDQWSDGIDLGSCWQWQGKYLLYVGISPIEPPKNGAAPSKNNLRKRIRRIGRTERKYFGEDESVLSTWLEQNAFVTWTWISTIHFIILFQAHANKPERRHGGCQYCRDNEYGLFFTPPCLMGFGNLIFLQIQPCYSSV